MSSHEGISIREGIGYTGYGELGRGSLSSVNILGHPDSLCTVNVVDRGSRTSRRRLSKS